MCECIVKCLIQALTLNTLFVYAAMLYSPDVSDPAVSYQWINHGPFQFTDNIFFISYGRKAWKPGTDHLARG